eukprot:COSAG06_NODE_4447_length_4255_cov_2.954764_2_plen_428_part_00
MRQGRCKYGVGVYFAADARLAAYFQRATRDSAGQKQLFLARVSLGNTATREPYPNHRNMTGNPSPELIKTEWRLPPPGAQSAKSREGIEAIVYSSYQAFPQYLVTYTAGKIQEPYPPHKDGALTPELRKIDDAPLTSSERIPDGDTTLELELELETELETEPGAEETANPLHSTEFDPPCRDNLRRDGESDNQSRLFPLRRAKQLRKQCAEMARTVEAAKEQCAEMARRVEHLEAYPDYWADFPEGEDQLQFELVGREEPELVTERERMIARIIEKDAPFAAEAVISLKRIQNKQLWQRYAAEREILRKKPRNAGNANERGTPVEDNNGPACNHLYHGAKGNVQAVLESGPMARFSVKAGGHQGTWTHEQASYSCGSFSTTKQVFACRAVLGTPGNDKTFDCHGQGGPVYVFWNDSAVYTEYLFEWE